MRTSIETPSRIDEEAALWFATRRRGVMSLEERAMFESWRRVPANAAAIAEQERVWEALQIAQDQLGPERTPVHSNARARVGRPALLAVMCAASIAIGVISYSGHHDFWTTLDWVER
jgi:ferric-dicitrate binding protein FerR (iron transport regulator)